MKQEEWQTTLILTHSSWNGCFPILSIHPASEEVPLKDSASLITLVVSFNIKNLKLISWFQYRIKQFGMLLLRHQKVRLVYLYKSITCSLNGSAFVRIFSWGITNALPLDGIIIDRLELDDVDQTFRNCKIARQIQESKKLMKGSIGTKRIDAHRCCVCNSCVTQDKFFLKKKIFQSLFCVHNMCPQDVARSSFFNAHILHL